MGVGRYAEELVLTMHCAAGAALAQAQALLRDGVKKMALGDATAILALEDDAATQHCRRAEPGPLRGRFVPIARKAIARVRLVEKHDYDAARAAGSGLTHPGDANLAECLTREVLDGLFLMIAGPDRQIRKDPVAAGFARSTARRSARSVKQA